MSMDYILAKELKDAGFPQKKNADKIGRYKYMAYEPTLEELIEACAPRFAMLGSEDGEYWYARADQPCNECASFEPVGDGKTASEAVARLWLELKRRL